MYIRFQNIIFTIVITDERTVEETGRKHETSYSLAQEWKWHPVTHARSQLHNRGCP